MAKREKIKTKRENKISVFEKSNLFVSGGFDIPFFATIFALLTIGLIMLFSASYPYALQKYDNSYHFIVRQLLFVIVGVCVMMFVSKLNYKVFKALTIPLVVITFLLLIIVLFYHTDVKDFKRWIPFGPISIQPSDIAKFTITLTLATYFSKYYKYVKKTSYGILFPLLIIAAFCGLIFLEHHLSCTILMFVIGASIMFCSGTNIWLFIIGLSVVAGAVVFVISNPQVLMDYAGERIEAWLNKEFEPRDARWQINNSLYAIGSGGLFGVGIGNSIQKYLYVSEPQNDFIFAIVCEELGFVGAAIIIILFAFLFIRGVYIAINCSDKFGSLLVIGIVAQVAAQTILNIMVVTDTIPNTGIALPFFSYGGTAILMLLFEMGVVLAVSRKTNQKRAQ